MTTKTKTIKDNSNVIGFRKKDIAIRKKWDKELKEIRANSEPKTLDQFTKEFNVDAFN